MKGNRIFSKKFGLILLLPSALIFLLVSVYPLCTGLILSFQNNSLFSSDQVYDSWIEIKGITVLRLN